MAGAWNYHPLGGTRLRLPRSNLVLLATTILSTLAALTLFALRDGHRRPVPRFPYSLLPPSTCDAALPPSSSEIPNIVHYVWLTRDPHLFTLDFRAFLTIYSSHLHLRPTAIYIHTDALPSSLADTTTKLDLWTRRILALPGVTPNHITPPTHTSSGVPLTRIEHKSDLVRLQALREFGGVYLDLDAIPLRDLSPLRTAGFGAVVGPVTAVSVWQGGMLNNGVMLSAPHGALVEIYYQAYDRFFTGEWDTASVVLLTDLAMRAAAVPRAVLVVEAGAFAPFSWEVWDMNRLYGFLLGKPEGEGERGVKEVLEGGTCGDAMAWLREREKGREEKDEVDLSNTYVLHAFSGNLGRFHGLFSPRLEVDLEYVMRRESNFARAVWPAVKHAIEAGLLPEAKVGG